MFGFDVQSHPSSVLSDAFSIYLHFCQQFLEATVFSLTRFLRNSMAVDIDLSATTTNSKV